MLAHRRGHPFPARIRFLNQGFLGRFGCRVGTGGVNGVVLEQQGTENMKYLRKLIGDTKGATAIEYGLIAALIAVAAITAMGTLGNTLGNTFNNVSTKMGGTEASAG